MSSHAQNRARARVVSLRLVTVTPGPTPAPAPREPLWRDVVGDVLRRERLAQERTLKDVAEAARISMPYLSEIERGRKEASSEVLAAAARSLGLGLAEVLSLAQEELARRSRVRLPSRTTAARPAPARLSSTQLSSTWLSPSRMSSSSRAPMGEVRLAA
ncbi:helix-turn-helix transcriptional regulator [Streptomyces sp. NPDC020403]|uniref:helix-turn-helix domain-containing protein n=1 Tax=unclassified Streptomyces TaxID=2593676 RepID=UPI0033FE41DF